MAKIIGVKFRNSGKVYYFAPKKEEYKRGDGVIVETAKGMEYGKVVIPVKEIGDDELVSPLKPVIRKATAKDDANIAKGEEKREESMKIAAEKIAARGLEMKLIDCEYAFDGSKIIFYFSAEGRVDFRELVRDLASAFHARIELRQVGIRDETKILGGIAPCGRACCCSSCLPDFKKVSIKMAKTQGLSLNPTKISGLCGRLMCCLEYENNHYSETFKKMPKIGSEVSTPDGKGTVVTNNMLKMLVKVKIEGKDGELTYKDFALDDVRFKKNPTQQSGKDKDETLTEEEKAVKHLED